MAENKDKDIVMKCRHMEKVYPGTKALDDVDFNIYRGKVNVLIGENGAGKSTLMKQIAGIEQPSSGKMYQKYNRGESKGSRYHSSGTFPFSQLKRIPEHFYEQRTEKRCRCK